MSRSPKSGVNIPEITPRGRPLAAPITVHRGPRMGAKAFEWVRGFGPLPLYRAAELVPQFSPQKCVFSDEQGLADVTVPPV